ncbi:MAG: hypothetical protein LH606_19980 [Cytophagaceae bacterium]|nr:hypothetical protein [Cytophagaceae bacterium]
MKQLADLLGRIASLIVGIVVTAGLAVAAWGMWYGYQEARLQRRFVTEGQPVEVIVRDVSRERKTWLDAFGNSAYVDFPYRGRNYTTRFASDTLWVSAGDRVQLLYHPQLDAFRQPVTVRKPGRVTSRLIKWSVVAGFSREYQLLAGFLLVAAALFFFGGGVLVMITGWTFIQDLARLVLVALLAAGALFFTYDSIAYYRYYQHLRSQGQPLEVTALDKYKTAHGRRSVSWYTYDATIRFENQERVIPIEEDEYEMLRPPAPLRVLYDREQDDLVSATYAMEYSQFFAPVFLWVLLGVVLWKQDFKKRKLA